MHNMISRQQLQLGALVRRVPCFAIWCTTHVQAADTWQAYLGAAYELERLFGVPRLPGLGEDIAVDAARSRQGGSSLSPRSREALRAAVC